MSLPMPNKYVLHCSILGTLPTGPDGDYCFYVRRGVQRPVVDDFRVVDGVISGRRVGGGWNPLVAINVQSHFGKVDADGVVVPGVITNL